MKENHLLLLILILGVLILNNLSNYKQFIFRIILLVVIFSLAFHYQNEIFGSEMETGLETLDFALMEKQGRNNTSTDSLKPDDSLKSPSVIELERLMVKFNYWYHLAEKSCQKGTNKDNTSLPYDNTGLAYDNTGLPYDNTGLAYDNTGLAYDNTRIYYREILNNLNSLGHTDVKPTPLKNHHDILTSKMEKLDQRYQKYSCLHPLEMTDNTKEFLYNPHYSVF